MKNVKYILLLVFGAVLFSFFIVSCSNLLDNVIEFDNLEGEMYISEDGNKIIFRNNKISIFFNGENLIFEDYKILVNNMISLNAKDKGLEVEEIRIYLLKDNSIYSTLDNRYYYS